MNGKGLRYIPTRIDDTEDAARPITAIILAACIVVAIVFYSILPARAQSFCPRPYEVTVSIAASQGWQGREMKGAAAVRLTSALNAVEPVTDHNPDRVMLFRHDAHAHLVVVLVKAECVLLILALDDETALNKILRQTGA